MTNASHQTSTAASPDASTLLSRLVSAVSNMWVRAAQRQAIGHGSSEALYGPDSLPPSVSNEMYRRSF